MINPRPEYQALAESKALSMAKGKLYKEKIKAQLAVLTQSYMDGKRSFAAAENMAKASPEYHKFLAQAEEVMAEEIIARAKMKAIEMEHEYMRSMNSLEKVKIKELNLI